MSGRKLSLWLNGFAKDLITYPTLCKLVDRISSEVQVIRSSPIDERIDAIIVDGIWGKFRRLGRGVILVAFGVTPGGSIHLLDWSASKSESVQSLLKLLQHLKDRGLTNISPVIGDGTLGLPKSARLVYPNSLLPDKMSS